MSDRPSLQTWADLRLRRPDHDDVLETVDATPVIAGSMFGIDRRGDRHLLLPVAGPAGRHSTMPDLRGLRVRHRVLGSAGDFVDVCASACHQRMFSPLCEQIIDAVSIEQRRPWDAVFSTLRDWQTAWKAAAPAMEKSVQVGLYGELLVLERVMIPALGPRAVDHWSGPDQERHDFVGHGIHMEVKTTRRRRHEHEISRADQLSVPASRRLLLLSILLEESTQGTYSLADRIDAVLDQVRLDATASDNFMAKLVRLGWSEEMRSTGELLRFFDGFNALALPVEGAFPRLPDDLVLPSGIVGLRYTVDLSNLPS
ncbi:MAG: PD-(D/E)XK motif protein, partial [Comamonadaceae bacterium]